MENKMEHDMETLGPFKGVYGDTTPVNGEPNGKDNRT